LFCGGSPLEHPFASFQSMVFPAIHGWHDLLALSFTFVALRFSSAAWCSPPSSLVPPMSTATPTPLSPPIFPPFNDDCADGRTGFSPCAVLLPEIPPPFPKLEPRECLKPLRLNVPCLFSPFPFSFQNLLASPAQPAYRAMVFHSFFSPVLLLPVILPRPPIRKSPFCFLFFLERPFLNVFFPSSRCGSPKTYGMFFEAIRRRPWGLWFIFLRFSTPHFIVCSSSHFSPCAFFPLEYKALFWEGWILPSPPKPQKLFFFFCRPFFLPTIIPGRKHRT